MKVGDKIRVKPIHVALPDYINTQGFIIDFLPNDYVAVRVDDSFVEIYHKDDIYVIWENKEEQNETPFP